MQFLRGCVKDLLLQAVYQRVPLERLCFQIPQNTVWPTSDKFQYFSHTLQGLTHNQSAAITDILVFVTKVPNLRAMTQMCQFQENEQTINRMAPTSLESTTSNRRIK